VLLTFPLLVFSGALSVSTCLSRWLEQLMAAAPRDSFSVSMQRVPLVATYRISPPQNALSLAIWKLAIRLKHPFALSRNDHQKTHGTAVTPNQFPDSRRDGSIAHAVVTVPSTIQPEHVLSTCACYTPFLVAKPNQERKQGKQMDENGAWMDLHLFLKTNASGFFRLSEACIAGCHLPFE
jgi:hypothetical protein